MFHNWEFSSHLCTLHINLLYFVWLFEDLFATAHTESSHSFFLNFSVDAFSSVAAGWDFRDDKCQEPPTLVQVLFPTPDFVRFSSGCVLFRSIFAECDAHALFQLGSNYFSKYQVLCQFSLGVYFLSGFLLLIQFVFEFSIPRVSHDACEREATWCPCDCVRSWFFSGRDS